MRNNRGFAALALLVPFLLAACGEEEQIVQEEVARPVKTIVIADEAGAGIRRFPARIESSRRADLSFRVAGKVEEIRVREGERVSIGDTIARLDPVDYKLAVDDRRATFERAQKDFDRASELIKTGFIPRQQYDRRESDLKSAEAALRRAERDLGYTELKASFDGEISRRYVEAFEDVKAKQPIVAMRDIESLEVKFDVPEQIIIRVNELHADPTLPDPPVEVSFEAAPAAWFPLDFKEMAAQADRATQTFEITYTMTAPTDLLVLPGMTANVKVDLSDVLRKDQPMSLPVEAVEGGNDLNPRVWIVDEDTMTVKPRAVKVGRMRSGLIAVTEGLAVGDRVVVAGVPFLTEGMKVWLLPEIEQAAERAEDAEVRRNAEQRLQEQMQDEAKEDAPATN